MLIQTFIVLLLCNRHFKTKAYLVCNIYIRGVFTEKPYSKPLERNVVYIPIKTSPRDVSDVKINHGFPQSDRKSALFHNKEKD